MDAIARFITLAAPIQSDRLPDADDLVAGAGSDLIEQYQSVQDAAIIDTSNVGFYDIKLTGAAKCSVIGRATPVILTIVDQGGCAGNPGGLG